MTQSRKIAQQVQQAARKVPAPDPRGREGVKISADAVEQIIETIRDNDKAISFLAKV